MTSRRSIVAAGLSLLLAGPAHAAGACAGHFEVAGGGGTPVPAKRATKTAAGGACEFAVRLALGSAGSSCAATEIRGVAADAVSGAATAGWQRVTLKQRARRVSRRLLRARIRGDAGRSTSARLRLRCEPTPAPDGCAPVLAESTYCFLGGGHRVRVVGLESGAVCRDSPKDLTDPEPALHTADLAVWNGEAYTCSPDGAFVSVPVDGGKPRPVAGPCRAVTTDGEALLVLPDAGFDGSSSAGASGADSDLSKIRAYDLPESVPGGPFRVVFDLSTIPPDSPCAGLTITVMTARDGIVHATGCRMDSAGICVPENLVCAFDTMTGTTRPPLTLEGFTGEIRGLSAMSAGRLAVLTNDRTPVPPVGYFPDQPLMAAATDTLHVFDGATGARLDSRPLESADALGLACVSHDS